MLRLGSKRNVTHLNLQSISIVSLDKGGDNVSQDKVALLPEVEADTLEACVVVSAVALQVTRRRNPPEPGSPMMLLLLAIRTLALPVITPLMTTIAGAVLASSTAAVNWASVETVVTVPPAPPFVLDNRDTSATSRLA